MKIVLHLRSLMAFLLISCLSFIPNFVSAQCSNCDDNSATITECGTSPNTIIYDLTGVVTPSGSNTLGYYNQCGGNGNGGAPNNGSLSDTISTPGAFTPTGADVLVYIAEYNGTTCEGVTEVTLAAINLGVTISPGPTATFCAGGSVTLTATVTGNDGSFTTLWTTPGGFSGTKTLPTIEANVAGTYSVTVMNNGCSATSSPNVAVSQSALSVTVSPSPTATFCPGGSVDLTATVTGANGSFTSNWNTPGGFSGTSNDPIIAANAAGNYSVLIDDGECTVTSSPNVTVSQSALSVSVSPSPTATFCPGGSVNLTATVTGANGSFTSNWNTPGGFSGTSNDPIIAANAAGNYSVLIDDGECTVTSSPNVAVSESTLAVSVSPSPTATFCAGSSVDLTATVTGANGSFTSNWNTPGGFSGTSNDPIIAANAAGNYSVLIDDGECTVTSSPNVAVSQSTLAVSVSPSPSALFCPGGSVALTATVSGANGGSFSADWNTPGSFSGTKTNPTINADVAGSYSVEIDDGECIITSSPSVSVSQNPALNPTISGDLILCSTVNSTLLTVNENYDSYSWSGGGTGKTKTVGPGTHTVTVMDNGCTGMASVTVTQLSAIGISLSPSSKTSVTCSGVCDGSLTVNVSGGNGNYNFAWTGPSFSSGNQNITGLCAGNYTLVVTDSEGCSSSMMFEITTPVSVSISTNPSPASCFGFSNGSIMSTPSGGTSPYQISWTGPNSYTSTLEDITNVPAGTYTVVVTDDNNCSSSSVAVVNQPDPVPAAISPASAAICLDKSTSLTASGGVSYLWNNGEGSSPAITVSPTSTTTYVVTVTDATGCSASASSSVTVNPLPQPSVSVTENSGISSSDQRICDDDVVTLTASGAPSLIWGGGKANPLVEAPGSTTTYEVLATDGNGCTGTAEVTIEVDQNPNAIIINKAEGIDGDVQNLETASTANCGGSTFLSCEWLVDGVQISTNCGNISPVISGKGERLVELRVVNECGCEDTDNTTIDIVSADDCQVLEFSVNNGAPFACVDVFVPYVQNNQTSNAGTCPFEVPTNLKIFKNNIDVTNITSIVTVSGSMIRFREEGAYELRNQFIDECGCQKNAPRFITVVPAPEASFAPNNPTKVCEGESYTINLSGYDDDETVFIEGVTGSGAEPYQTNSFIYTPGSPGSKTLSITSVDNGVCDAEISGEVLDIEVIPEFKLVEQNGQDGCNEDGDMYDLTIITEGGDPNASISLMETGFTTKLLGENGFVIEGLNPLLTYDFTLIRGDVCDPLLIPAKEVICACEIRMAPRPEVDFVGCEGEEFNIEGIFDPRGGDSDFDPFLDTLLYVIHNSGAGGKSGSVFKVLPADAKVVTSDFNNFVLGSEFYLSPVGIPKAVLDRFDFEDPNTFSNQGTNECLSIVPGIRMIWYQNPSPVIRTELNADEICKNEYSFMVVADQLLEGSDPDISVDGLGDEFIQEFGSEDTAFIFFQYTGQDSFVIRVKESKLHFDNVRNENFLCESEVTKTVYVKEGIGSPDLSQIILWPGNIFASTADPATTCFEWGYFNQGTERSGLGNEKYYYAPTDLNLTTTTRKYFVDTWNCEDPSCVTRIFYNNAGPPPGLQIKDLQNFSYVVRPNPNKGRFNIDLYSKVDSDVNLQIISITGNQIESRKESLNQGKNVLDFDFYDVPKGIYFLKIHDKSNNQYSIEKIVIN